MLTKLYTLALAWVLALLGGFFAVAGGVLVSLGGSPYYIVAGVLMVASGALYGRGRPAGAWLYTAVFVGTWVWALWEVGPDWMQLFPRVLAPTVLLIAVWLPALWQSRHRIPARQTASAAAGLVAMIAAGGVLTIEGRGRAQDAPPAPVASAASNNDWRYYGGTLAGDRFSTLDQINAGNVDKLDIAWTQRSGDMPYPAEAKLHQREFHAEATPIHIGDTLYTCSPHSFIQAIDATTGQTKWTWREHGDLKGRSYLVCRGVAYFEAPAGSACPHRIFAPTFRARIVALDADTGRLCASFGKGGAIDLTEHMAPSGPGGQVSTAPPLVVNGRLIVGERIDDNISTFEPAGVVRAYDPVDGHEIWAWDLGRSQDAIAPLTGNAIYTRATPNVWGAMTADAANGLVYLPLGNATPDYWIGKRRPFDDRFGTSLVALDIATGKFRWSRQFVHRDMWDSDLAVGPSLFDYRAPNGQVIPALIQTTKMGQIYFLNRLTGAPLAAIQEKPVDISKALPFQRPSPTQPYSVGMPSLTPRKPTEATTWGATPIDHLLCRIDFKRARAAGIYAQIGLDWAIGDPGFAGVSDWGGASIDPVHQRMTINTMSMPFQIRLARRDDPQVLKIAKRDASGGLVHGPGLYPQYGTPYVALAGPWLSAFGAPCLAPPWGTLKTIDLASRRIAWDAVFGTSQDNFLFGLQHGVPIKMGVPNLGGTITTAGNLVFVGATTDRYLRAYDTRTGKVLWRGRLPAGGQATPMTYRGRDGRQYVVINAGGNSGMNTKLGDYTIAFALPRS